MEAPPSRTRPGDPTLTVGTRASEKSMRESNETNERATALEQEHLKPPAYFSAQNRRIREGIHEGRKMGRGGGCFFWRIVTLNGSLNSIVCGGRGRSAPHTHTHQQPHNLPSKQKRSQRASENEGHPLDGSRVEMAGQQPRERQRRRRRWRQEQQQTMNNKHAGSRPAERGGPPRRGRAWRPGGRTAPPPPSPCRTRGAWPSRRWPGGCSGRQEHPPREQVVKATRGGMRISKRRCETRTKHKGGIHGDGSVRLYVRGRGRTRDAHTRTQPVATSDDNGTSAANAKRRSEFHGETPNAQTHGTWATPAWQRRNEYVNLRLSTAIAFQAAMPKVGN